ncbi:MAG: XTP/dITP diphosphatase, partial [Deltaproteobacteria bacterium]|nr:XTP/dITP diphosphatase [Deltaproteobacteria bacterium]
MAKSGNTARVVIATRNLGKLDELRRILHPLGLTLLGLDAFPRISEVEETGASFRENALLKARAIAREARLPALADDSGLEVEHLGGEPGIYSARYAGEPRSDARNNQKLLAALKEVPDAARAADFVCVAAAALPSGEAIWEEGRWRGAILRAPRGTSGFGYDPLFFDHESGRSAAELESDRKDARSHRGKAFRKLAERLPDFLPALLE